MAETKAGQTNPGGNEDLYRSLFENMLNGFAYCRMLFNDGIPQDFIYLAVNDAFKSQTGLKDVVGKKVTEVIPGIRETDPQLFEIYGRVAMTGQPERFEVFVEALQMWLSISVYSPALEYFVAVFDVITERKRAEVALRESEERLSSIYNTTGDVIFLLDVEQDGEYRFNTVNPAFLSTTGLPTEFVVGKSVKEVIPEPSLTLVLSKYRQAIQEKTIVRWEETSDYPTGKLSALVTIAPILDADGICRHLVGNVHDITDRKRAERALREIEERHRIILQTSMDGFWMVDVQGNLLEVNETYCRMSGYSARDLLTMSILDLEVSETTDDLAAHVRKVMAQGEDRFETRHRRKDGSIFDVEVSVQYRPTDIGLFVAFLRDITDRKQAEEALRENKQLLEMTFLSLHEAVFIIDATNVRILDCNTAASEIFGYSREKMLGRTTTFLHVDEASLEEFRTRLYPAVEGKGYLFLPEFKMKREDGTVFLTQHSVTPLKNKQGQRIGWVSVIRDLTEIKRTEEALRESEARFRDFAELLPEIVFEIDQQGILTFWNQNAFKSFRYTQEDFEAGLNVLDAVAPDDRGRARENIQRILKDGYTGSNEYLMRRKDGSVFPSLVFSKPIFRDGMSVSLRGFIIDITERKQMEEELRKSHDELEVRVLERTAELAQSNKELTIEIAERLKMEQALQESKKELRILASQILTGQENERKRIALEVHDVLGSSLSAIKFKAEEALQHLPKNGTLNILIAKPLEALIPLVQDTIEEARRIQANLRPPLLDDLGIVTTLSWFCRRFGMIYSAIKVEQAITIQEEEIPDHLKIILFRITQEAMNNIGKYANANSVYLGLQKIDNSVIELCIKDNGEGFDPESLSSRKSLKKGLGLSSMKERVESSGGFLSIESAKGKGTVVLAFWPV